MADELTEKQKKDLALSTTTDVASKAVQRGGQFAGYGATIGSLIPGAGTAAGAFVGAQVGAMVGAGEALLSLPENIKSMKEANKRMREANEKKVLGEITKERKRVQKGLQATGGEPKQSFVTASEAADFASLGPATQYDTLMTRAYGV